MKGTAGVTKLTSGTTTKESNIASAPQLIGEEINPKIIFDTVRPIPTMKLAHTAALEIRPLYKPHRSGPKNAPANAPQEILHELRNKGDSRGVLNQCQNC